MNHKQLIALANALGYTEEAGIPEKGICRGFTMSWILAACSNMLDSFYGTLKLLEEFQDIPEYLPVVLAQTKDLVEEGLIVGVTSDKVKNLLAIEDFFKTIGKFQDPEKYAGEFGEILIQSDSNKVSRYIQQENKQKIALEVVHFDMSQFGEKELAEYLYDLSCKLNKQPISPLIFKITDHAASALVKHENMFEYIDTSVTNEFGNIQPFEVTSDELACIIFRSNEEYVVQDSLFIEIKIYVDAEHVQILEQVLQTFSPKTNDNFSQIIHLFNSAFGGDLQAISAVIDYPGFNYSAINRNGLMGNFIQNFSSDESLDIAKKLANKGFDFSSVDEGKRNFLHYHLSDKYLELAELFIDKGCNPQAIYQEKTSLNYNFHAPKIVNLLIEQGVDSNFQINNSDTPLHQAAKAGFIDSLQLLLRKGNADANLINREGYTALDLACKSNYPECIDLLLPYTDIKIEDLESNSLLSQAIQYCDKSTQLVFLQKSLQCYIQEANFFTGILNYFGIDTDKTTAAKALLENLQGGNNDLSIYIESLEEGRLNNLYKMYQGLDSTDIPQSYTKVSTALGATLKSAAPIASKEKEEAEEEIVLKIEPVPVVEEKEEQEEKSSITPKGSPN